MEASLKLAQLNISYDGNLQSNKEFDLTVEVEEVLENLNEKLTLKWSFADLHWRKRKPYVHEQGFLPSKLSSSVEFKNPSGLCFFM